MGSEILIVVGIVIVVIIGAAVLMRSREDGASAEGALGPPASFETDKKEEQPSPQSPPNRQLAIEREDGESVLLGSTVPDISDVLEQTDDGKFDDADEDEYMEEAEEEEITEDAPEDKRATGGFHELDPLITDTQMMKAITPSDTEEFNKLSDEEKEDFSPAKPLIRERQKSEAPPSPLAPPQAPEIDRLPEMQEQPATGSNSPALPSESQPGQASQDPDTKKLFVGGIQGESKETPPATTAHFSAYYPDTATAEQRYSVIVYAHAENMLEQINTDVSKHKEALGGNIPPAKSARESKSLAHGTKITVLLESEELEFEPEMLTKRWHGDWTKYEFEFRAPANLIGETAYIRASIMVMGFEIAKIKFTIEITEPQMNAMVMSRTADPLPDNPFARAKLLSTTTTGYDKIFISYSRKDKLIAQAFKLMQEAAGNDVFFDVDDIRTGEDWQAAIARAIDEADYLQLFWSENSAESEWCQYEWDYALNYKCQDDNCREFIRPVWWLAPMPDPPEFLQHLNFRRMDFESLMSAE